MAAASARRLQHGHVVCALAIRMGSQEFEPDHASRGPPAYVGKGRIRQGYQAHRRKEPPPNGAGNADWTEGVRLSLFHSFDKLPPDGQLVTDEEAGCDPYHGHCKTAMNVWESKCRVCCGTGSTVSTGRRRRTLHTCLMCHGLGFVRRSSATVTPELGSGKNQTLGRAASSSRQSPAEVKAAPDLNRAAQNTANPAASNGAGKASATISTRDSSASNGASHSAASNGTGRSSGSNGAGKASEHNGAVKERVAAH